MKEKFPKYLISEEAHAYLAAKYGEIPELTYDDREAIKKIGFPVFRFADGGLVYA